jgi:hypothetical protein
MFGSRSAEEWEDLDYSGRAENAMPGLPRARFAVILLLGVGCAPLRNGGGECAEGGPAKKTLLTWSSADQAEKGKNGDDTGANGESVPSREEEKPLESDRPDFTEASSTVGKGRVQLEAGYTFIRDRSGGATTSSHSYPEALLRIGALADWLEFRLGQNFGHTRTGAPHAVFSAAGAEDLYLGTKLGLTEQARVLPEMALILQTTVPTGEREFTAGKMQPGLNWLYGWDVIPDHLTLGGSTQGNKALDAAGHGYVELAQSLTVGYVLTERLAAYTEWFAFFPCGAVAPSVGALHYLDGGFTYKVTPNLQFDIRAGVGLSRLADDYFVGSGFAARY